jgi:hypothetical protein
MVQIALIVVMVILILAMVKVAIRVKASRLREYFRENLGAPFVVGFQVLLLVCAGLLIQGDSGLANEVAVYAYSLLVAGSVLQLGSFVRRGEEVEEYDYGRGDQRDSDDFSHHSCER